MVTHKSDCATHNAPAFGYAAPCTCGADAPVEVVIDYEKNRYKTMHQHPRTATSWHANFFIETLKICLMTSVRDGEDSRGDPIMRPLTPQEAMERAIPIVDKAIHHMIQRKWVVSAPSLADLKDDSSSEVGFTRRDA